MFQTILETKIVLVDGVWCAEFTATHFSPYAMVVDKTAALSNIGKTTVPEVVATPSATPTTTKNPKSGGSNPIGTFTTIAILSAITIVVVNKKRKFKVLKKG